MCSHATGLMQTTPPLASTCCMCVTPASLAFTFCTRISPEYNIAIARMVQVSCCPERYGQQETLARQIVSKYE